MENLKPLPAKLQAFRYVDRGLDGLASARQSPDWSSTWGKSSFDPQVDPEEPRQILVARHELVQLTSELGPGSVSRTLTTQRASD